ncbi:MAG TPA: hypothetical protein VNX29_16030 [Kaistia sp.]|nr:hypothetical protein [Kaistia sp.]
MVTALSIMIAAVFVRLNRGMPALEWKSVDPAERRNLTAAVVQVAVEYAWIVAVSGTAVAALLTLSIVGKADAAHWPEVYQTMTSGLIGAVVGLTCSRMAYVVWRDIDIVRLQKRLIDGIAERDATGAQAAMAEDKVTSIRAAGLRPVEVKAPKAWGD